MLEFREKRKRILDRAQALKNIALPVDVFIETNQLDAEVEVEKEIVRFPAYRGKTRGDITTWRDFSLAKKRQIIADLNKR